MIEVPRAFRAMPRWRDSGQDWLAALPALVERQCRRWRLEPDGAPMRGRIAVPPPDAGGPQRTLLRHTPRRQAWGPEHGLTEDPVRCERIVRIFG